MCKAIFNVAYHVKSIFDKLQKEACSLLTSCKAVCIPDVSINARWWNHEAEDRIAEVNVGNLSWVFEIARIVVAAAFMAR
jgi:hypothetical protein